MKVNLAKYQNRLSWRNKLGRAVWGIVWVLFYRLSPRPLHGWRRFLLRCFGAKVGCGAHPYPRARIWAPWNLEMGEHSCLADEVNCYCVAKVTLEPHSLVSQYSYLCTATHDFNDPSFALIAAPIIVGRGAWVAADVFIGPGVTIGEGAVVGARASVYKDVAPWVVVGGNPARFLKSRLIQAP